MPISETSEVVRIRGEIARDIQTLYKYGIRYEVTIQNDQLIIKIDDIDDAEVRYDIKEHEDIKEREE